MEQYIDKDAVVAEIEGLKRISFTNFDEGVNSAVQILLDFINTLETKEVDLEKVFNDEYSKFSNDVDAMDYGFPIDLADYKDFAKHFFELGLKAQKGGEE